MLFHSKGEGNMEVIKFQDFLDRNYTLEELPTVTTSEKVFELIMIGCLAVAVIQVIPHIALPIMKGAIWL